MQLKRIYLLCLFFLFSTACVTEHEQSQKQVETSVLNDSFQIKTKFDSMFGERVDKLRFSVRYQEGLTCQTGVDKFAVDGELVFKKGVVVCAVKLLAFSTHSKGLSRAFELKDESSRRFVSSGKKLYVQSNLDLQKKKTLAIKEQGFTLYYSIPVKKPFVNIRTARPKRKALSSFQAQLLRLAKECSNSPLDLCTDNPVCRLFEQKCSLVECSKIDFDQKQQEQCLLPVLQRIARQHCQNLFGDDQQNLSDTYKHFCYRDYKQVRTKRHLSNFQKCKVYAPSNLPALTIRQWQDCLSKQ